MDISDDFEEITLHECDMVNDIDSIHDGEIFTEDVDGFSFPFDSFPGEDLSSWHHGKGYDPVLSYSSRPSSRSSGICGHSSSLVEDQTHLVSEARRKRLIAREASQSKSFIPLSSKDSGTKGYRLCFDASDHDLRRQMVINTFILRSCIIRC